MGARCGKSARRALSGGRPERVVPTGTGGPGKATTRCYPTAPLLAACLAGQGIAQVIELYVREHLADGRLVQVLPEWAEEPYPLYAYHHSAQLMSVKVRAFLEFVVALTRA
ncbi:LysR substrate-binding domain-containing protein [Sorangium sp. So ce1014]|uniref:LysR substrate-binding domain-containing protein n=1 Tax=Sorangium sp. So ce1014 TaxID=3133326 RepID=UPI003F5ED1A2